MSFARPTLTALIARVAADIVARLQGADSRLRRNVLDVFGRALAALAHGLYGAIQSGSEFLPDRCEEERLRRWAFRIYQIPEKPAVAATGTAAIAGDDAAEVPAGTILVRADGALYLVDADVTIAAGVGSLALTAVGAGIDGGMAEGQLLTFQSPIAGIGATAIVEAPGITGGVEEEGIEALRARVLSRMRNPARGGAEQDYVDWALEVPAATRAWVYPNWDGLGTVKVLFVCDGREDIIPEAGDITAVESWIAPRRPVTAEVTVAGPLATAQAFDIDLVPNTAEVQDAVEAALRDLIAREAEPGGTLKISHIREAISTAAGETDHVLNSPTANVTPAAGHITTLGAITW